MWNLFVTKLKKAHSRIRDDVDRLALEKMDI